MSAIPLAVAPIAPDNSVSFRSLYTVARRRYPRNTEQRDGMPTHRHETAEDYVMPPRLINLSTITPAV
jgi:hypothetical protein